MIAADAKIGYPPARVWGSPTTVDVGLPARPPAGQAAALHRRLAVAAPRRWSGAWRSRRPPPELSTSAPRRWSRRIARMPLNQLQMMKLLVNQTAARPGAARHPGAGHACSTGSPATRRRGTPSRRRAAREGFRAAVRGPRRALRQRTSMRRADRHRHPRAAARRRAGADRGGRLRRRLGDRDRRAGRGRRRDAVSPLRLQGGAVRRGVPVRVRARGAGDAGRRGRAAVGATAAAQRLETRARHASPSARCAIPRLAWALIAEPVDPRVDAERLAYRARYAALIAEGLRGGDRRRRAARAGRRADRGGARRRLRRGAGRPAVAAGRPTTGRRRRSSRRCGRSSRRAVGAR